MAIDIMFDYRPYRNKLHVSVRGRPEYEFSYEIPREVPSKEKFEHLGSGIDIILRALEKDFRKRKINFKINKPEIKDVMPGYDMGDYRKLIQSGIKKYNFKGKIMELD